MENFSTLPQIEINSSTKSCPHHAVFHSFLLNDSKQDAATTTAHSKCLIELLEEQKVLTSTLITLWGNTDGCAEQYVCASVLYIIRYSVEAHLYCDFFYFFRFSRGKRKKRMVGF